MINNRPNTMKKLLAVVLFTLGTSSAFADSIVVNGTRFIYPSKEKEITVQLTNNAKTPALVQTWLDEGNATVSPDEISTPFTITPPIAKIEGKSAQTLRIKAINKAIIPTDKESLWYLNVLEIPPTVANDTSESKNSLQMAIRSRFKFIYRPVNLGDRQNAKEQIRLSAMGNNLKIDNPTPFYITITSIMNNTKTPLNDKSILIAPKSNQTVKLKSSVHTNEKLQLVEMNDYGTGIKFEKTIQ